MRICTCVWKEINVWVCDRKCMCGCVCGTFGLCNTTIDIDYTNMYMRVKNVWMYDGKRICECLCGTFGLFKTTMVIDYTNMYRCVEKNKCLGV